MQCRRPGFDPWVGKIPWRRERLPTPVFWPGESHGLCSSWDRNKLDTTEQLHYVYLYMYDCSHSYMLSYKFVLGSFKCCIFQGVSCYEGLAPEVNLLSEVAQSCPTLCDPMDTRLLHPWDFLGTSTGVGCHFLLQGIFPTQGSNPGIPHCRQTNLLKHCSNRSHCVQLALQGHIFLKIQISLKSSYITIASNLIVTNKAGEFWGDRLENIFIY